MQILVLFLIGFFITLFGFLSVSCLGYLIMQSIHKIKSLKCNKNYIKKRQAYFKNERIKRNRENTFKECCLYQNKSALGTAIPKGAKKK